MIFLCTNKLNKIIPTTKVIRKNRRHVLDFILTIIVNSLERLDIKEFAKNKKFDVVSVILKLRTV